MWLHPEQIIDRDSLNTRPVQQNLFRELNNSGMFAEEIIRYIHHMVERCHAIESSGIVGRVPVDRLDTNSGLNQTLGQIIGLIGTWRPINSESSESSIVSIKVVDDPEIVSVIDESEEDSSSSDSSSYYPPTICPDTHAIYIDNVTRSHRIFYRPGLRMFPEVRCQVAILPRVLPDRCSICMAPVGECPQPCQWRPNYSRACSRRCDEQIRTNHMWDIFEVVDSDPSPELFPPHVIGRPTDPVTGIPYDPFGGTIYPRPLDFVYEHADYLHLRDIMPDRQYGDREEDHRRSMNDFQTAINAGNRQYLESMRRTTGTPPNGYFSGFEINIPAPPIGHDGHAVSRSRVKSMIYDPPHSTRVSTVRASVIEFECMGQRFQSSLHWYQIIAVFFTRYFCGGVQKNESEGGKWAASQSKLKQFELSSPGLVPQ